MKQMQNDFIYLNENMYLDMDQQDLVKFGLRIALSKRQFRLIYRLAQDLGHPVSSKELMSYTWGTQISLTKESLYVCVNRIRERLEADVHRPEYLISIKGFGYMLRSLSSHYYSQNQTR